MALWKSLRYLFCLYFIFANHINVPCTPVLEIRPLFSPSPGSRLRHPLKKGPAPAPESCFYRFLLPAPLPLKRPSSPVFNSFCWLRLPLKWPGSGSPTLMNTIMMNIASEVSDGHKRASLNQITFLNICFAYHFISAKNRYQIFKFEITYYYNMAFTFIDYMFELIILVWLSNFVSSSICLQSLESNIIMYTMLLLDKRCRSKKVVFKPQLRICINTTLKSGM